MKRYTTLLFDADHTLLDFDAAERAGLEKTFQRYGFPFGQEVKEFYRDLNDRLWRDYEKGLVSREEVLYSRFRTVFDRFGYDADPYQFGEEYLDTLAEGSEVIAGSREMLQAVKQSGHRMYIVTNGVEHVQNKRLLDAGIRSYFDDVFVSEAAGAQKPKRAFFDYTFARIPQLVLDETLLIGDSLLSDMLGANGAGIDSCWFNAKKQKNITDAVPTYEVSDWKEFTQRFLIGSDTLR